MEANKNKIRKTVQNYLWNEDSEMYFPIQKKELKRMSDSNQSEHKLSLVMEIELVGSNTKGLSLTFLRYYRIEK